MLVTLSEHSDDPANTRPQKLRLNNIVIGQFLYMKCKQSPEKAPKKNRKVDEVLPIVAYLSAIKPERGTDIMVNGITHPEGYCFAVSLIFSLLTMRFLYVLVLLKYIISVGNKMIFKINIYGVKLGKLSVNLTKVAKLKPPLRPSQNVIFQNLSLLSHPGCFDTLFNLFILFARNLGFMIHTFIISKLYKIEKQIRLMMVVFSVIICSNTSSCLASVDIGQENVNEQYDNKKILQLIGLAEAKHNIPPGLLAAIAKTESGMKPYALNMNGKSMTTLSKQESALMVRDRISSGSTNIDVGLMQLNWRWHGDQFTNIEEMLDIEKNIDYASKLLSGLYKQHKSWHKAVRYYHSATIEHHKKYTRRVVMCWLK